MRTTVLSIILLLIAGIERSAAQFHYQGRDRIGIKWEQVKSNDYRLVYPDYYRPQALNIAGFLDSVSPYIGYGFPDRIIRTPIILRTEGLISNGYVVWAPKRDELVTAPPTSTFAVPWLKQLSIHEWRHVVQMSSLKTGLTKVATWVLGEAGLSVGLLVVPKWQLEGDATNAETQLTEYGRGLQPDFTVEYRAMAHQPDFLKNSSDLWVCGSYRRHIPDIYKFGYQMIAAGETYYGTDLWGKTFSYAGKVPILITPQWFYLRKHYNTSMKKLRKRTFAELQDLWVPLGQQPNNFTTLTSPERSYTVYGNPMPAPDGKIVATKSSFDRPPSIVTIDTATGKERKVMPTGTFSSRPILSGDKLYWTEYKPHPIWEQKNSSAIRSLELSTGRRESFAKRETNYFVTPLDDGNFATVSLDSLSNSFIRLKDKDMKTTSDYRFEGYTTLHGLAFDSKTSTLAFIALDRQGMWIGGMEYRDGKLYGVRKITEPSVVSVRDLTASGGKLYFGSIASGKDEIHVLDIATGKEFQATKSQYGSYAPTGSGDKILFNSYSCEGYMISSAPADTTGLEPVNWSRLPKNTVNPERVKWEVPKADTIPMDDSTATGEVKRFHRWGRVFNVHTWAPIAFDGGYILEDRSLKIGFGATAMFQSTLSDMRGYTTYGWMNKDNWLKGSFIYSGLPVEISVGAEYGGGKQEIYLPSYLIGQEGYETAKQYFSANTSIALPLNLSAGANNRLLRPSFAVTHYNSKLYNAAAGAFDNGYQKYDAMLWWSNNLRESYRSITPRLGYALRAGVAGSFNKRFGTLYSLWGRAYLPGAMLNHSITLRGGIQTQSSKEFVFNSKVMRPRGVTDDYGTEEYMAMSANYTMPLVYPDWGWDGVLNLKRIYTNLFFDHSHGKYFRYGGGTVGLNHHSYGIDIGITFNIFRSADQTVVVTVADPSTEKGAWVGFSYTMNF